jgi:pimeloyl-ACP methyl ester carboxylesterase
VLVGYSYGGFVVTGALEHFGDRVRHLVYLDAFVPGDGDTVAGLAGADAGRGMIGVGRDWLVPPQPRVFDDPAEAAGGPGPAAARAHLRRDTGSHDRSLAP